MKTLVLLLTTIGLLIPFTGNSSQPPFEMTFQVKDAQGQPIGDELIEVDVTFARTDANGNKVPVYVERFTERTTSDGFFQRPIGTRVGDLPKIIFGKYDDVDFTDSTLCIRVDYRRIEQFNPPLITGTYRMFRPVPIAAQALKAEDADADPANEIQRLSKTGEEISLSNGGGTVTLRDDDPTNELQYLSFDEDTKRLYLENGNFVNLGSLSPFVDMGGALCTQKIVQAPQFTTKNGQTDIQEGKISFRYTNGFDGIEMGVDSEFGYPFISFIDMKGNTIASIRMGPDGFKLYQE